MDWKIELVAIPVTGVDRAKSFYVDRSVSTPTTTTRSMSLRFVQLTPPGSACSVVMGQGITDITRLAARRAGGGGRRFRGSSSS